MNWWSRLSRPWRRTLFWVGLSVPVWCSLILTTCDGSVNIAVDYRQKMQDLQPVGPDDERSWPLLRKAQAVEGEARLALLREAAGRARIGFQFHPKMELTDSGSFPGPGGGIFDETVMQVRLPQLAIVGAACQDLAGNMTAAAGAGDGPRATADAIAIIGLANQLATPGSTFIQQLVGWANLSVAATAIARDVTAHPEVFNDDELSRFAAALAGVDRSKFRLDLTVERFMMDDLLQRVYTDDGSGDGSLTLEGSIAIHDWRQGWTGLSSNNPRWKAVVTAPLHCLVAASRSEVAHRWHAYMDAVQAEADRQPWLRDGSAIDRIEAEMGRASELEQLRLELYFLLAPAIGSAIANGTRSEAMIDAARVVVAAEQYRRASGDWPESIDELRSRLGGTLPVDPWTGAPLHLGVVEGALRVWSLGMDRTDEGGCPSLGGGWGPNRLNVGTSVTGYFLGGSAATDSAPVPQLTSGWMAIPNPNGASVIRGDWVLWPHDPPAGNTDTPAREYPK